VGVTLQKTKGQAWPELASLKGAEAFVLHLCGVQLLVLRSSILTVFDIDEVNVRLENVTPNRWQRQIV
jgi:hypothetical protein